MGLWPTNDYTAEERRHDEIIGKFKDTREKHKAWVHRMFPNQKDVVRGAQDVIIEYESNRVLPPKSVEAVFDDHSSHLGYFLIVRGRLPIERELVERIRAATGETFEVDHVHSG